MSIDYNCPYNCNEGKVFNVALRKMVACPHCSELRKNDVQSDTVTVNNEEVSLSKSLNLVKSLIGLELSLDAIIPENAQLFLKSDSVTKVFDSLKELSDKALLGERPSYSILYNLGDRCNIDAFTYQYIMKAYKNGLTVAPFLSGRDLLKLRNEESIVEFSDTQKQGTSDSDLTFSSLVDKDICVLYYDAGATYNEVNAIKGLMQLRSRSGLPTIIFTLCAAYRYRAMISKTDYSENVENDLILARYISVEYTKDSQCNQVESDYSTSGKSMTTDEFNSRFCQNN